MKKQTYSTLIIIAVICISIFSAFSFIQNEQKKGTAWDVPAKYKNMANPHKSDATLVNVGKTLYVKHCRSCHGNTGLGDGVKAKSLATFPGEFNSPKFKAQTDGEIFFQSIIGRDEMPNYESKIPDEEDRWAVVMYIQSLK
jgi:mono/diheme cytochrome c family protein